MQSLVWGVSCLTRASLRLLALLGSGVGAFVPVSSVTGMPLYFALVAWGVWHARRSFARLEPGLARPSQTRLGLRSGARPHALATWCVTQKQSRAGCLQAAYYRGVL